MVRAKCMDPSGRRSSSTSPWNVPRASLPVRLQMPSSVSGASGSVGAPLEDDDELLPPPLLPLLLLCGVTPLLPELPELLLSRCAFGASSPDASAHAATHASAMTHPKARPALISGH